MTTIKSYTDIYQSKKLAEILPLESADMTWSLEYTITDETEWYITLGLDRAIIDDSFSYKHGYLVPAWSLAALLDILPLEVSINKQTDGVDTYYYIASCDARYCDIHSHRHINAIDACYETILKLHELKLL